jgi:hypothetical protein
MGNPVNAESIGPRVDVIAIRLVKWTGEAPEGEPDPIGHPQCEEVLEINVQTGARRVLYRRDENASVQ